MHSNASHAVTNAGAVLTVTAVTKRYGSGAAAVDALRGVSLSLAPGTFTAIMGPSGSGKSTLLQCAAGLEQPTSGEVTLAGRELGGLSDDELTVLRRDHAAFIFQAFNLMPALTVDENVRLPMRLAGRRVDEAAVGAAIRQVGLSERRTHLPGELSGGQQQRVAIARALAARADILFADEPTGALDSATAAEVLGVLRNAVRHDGQAILMTTHDPVAASHADTVLFVVDGLIAGEITAPTPARVAEALNTFAAARVGGR